MLVVIAIIGILAALLSGPLMKARESALKSTCANNLRQISYALEQYESPGSFDKAPAIDDRKISSPGDPLYPLLALFNAKQLTEIKLVTCPLNSSLYTVTTPETYAQNIVDSSASTTITAPSLNLGGSRGAYSHYLFTFYYVKNSAPSRVIAGDAAEDATHAYSPNHGDTAAKYDNGANALFKDGHVTASGGDYLVQGAAQAPGAGTTVYSPWSADPANFPSATNTVSSTIGNYYW